MPVYRIKDKLPSVFNDTPMVVCHNNKISYVSITQAHEALVDYAITNNIPIKDLIIEEIKEVDTNTMNTMLLSTIIEWATELQESFGKLLSTEFLHFEIDTPISIIVYWIREKTGYDLSFYLKNQI